MTTIEAKLCCDYAVWSKVEPMFIFFKNVLSKSNSETFEELKAKKTTEI